MFVTVRENAFGEHKVLEFCRGTYSEVCQGKLRVAAASEKPVHMWYLNLVVKRLSCILVPHSEIKSYVVVLSFYIKKIKRRTLQVSSSKHSIKKDMLFSLGQIEIILVGQGGSPPPLSPLPSSLAT